MRMTFDGEHRSGKGTQVELYSKHVQKSLLSVRGDGSYQGGLEGIMCDDDLAFRHHLNEQLFISKDNAIWDIAATACANVLVHPALNDRDVLIDRGPLSRAAYLLSMGMPSEDISEQMYPAFTYPMNDRIVTQDAVDLESIDFGRIIYLRVPTEILLSRVAPDDPKVDFRKSNIVRKAGLFDKAIDSMPTSIQDTIEIIDGSQDPETVLAAYTS